VIISEWSNQVAANANRRDDLGVFATSPTAAPGAGDQTASLNQTLK
jgi:hypothetical protein